MSAMIFRRVSTPFLKNAGLISKSPNSQSAKKHHKKFWDEVFCMQNIVVYGTCVKFFERIFFIELQNVKSTRDRQKNRNCIMIVNLIKKDIYLVKKIYFFINIFFIIYSKKDTGCRRVTQELLNSVLIKKIISFVTVFIFLSIPCTFTLRFHKKI